MATYGAPGKVYVENDWFDGPRAGIADIGGVPHRFRSLFDEKDDEYLGTFLVWPVDQATLDLEVEQWHIFVDWNASYEAGRAGTESLPGHGGIDARWDELDRLLKNSRSEVPHEARRAIAEMTRIDRNTRYAPSGPAYMLAWCLL